MNDNLEDDWAASHIEIRKFCFIGQAFQLFECICTFYSLFAAIWIIVYTNLSVCRCIVSVNEMVFEYCAVYVSSFFFSFFLNNFILFLALQPKRNTVVFFFLNLIIYSYSLAIVAYKINDESSKNNNINSNERKVFIILWKVKRNLFKFVVMYGNELNIAWRKIVTPTLCV